MSGLKWKMDERKLIKMRDGYYSQKPRLERILWWKKILRNQASQITKWKCLEQIKHELRS